MVLLETKRASGEGKEDIFERTTLRGKRGQLLVVNEV
jgi:hypothetical protein